MLKASDLVKILNDLIRSLSLTVLVSVIIYYYTPERRRWQFIPAH